MIKQTTLRLFIIFLSISTFCVGQKTKGTLVFKDGEIKEGLVKLSGADQVKFRVNKKDKAIKYNFLELEYAKIDNGEESSIYKLVVVEGKEKPIVLEEVVNGKVKLYNLNTSGYSPGFSPMGAGGMPMYTGGNYYSIKNLYVLKEGELQATHLGSNQLFTKNFKSAASEFFNDCPTLVEKIQNRDFKKKQIKEIVEYYNDNCQ